MDIEINEQMISDLKNRIYYTDIKYIGEKIEKFVEVYEDKIRLLTDDQKHIIKELKELAFLIRTQQYSKLFDKNQLIDFDPDMNTMFPF